MKPDIQQANEKQRYEAWRFLVGFFYLIYTFCLSALFLDVPAGSPLKEYFFRPVFDFIDHANLEIPLFFIMIFSGFLPKIFSNLEVKTGNHRYANLYLASLPFVIPALFSAYVCFVFGILIQLAF